MGLTAKLRWAARLAMVDGMGFWDGVSAVWLREVLVFYREKERVISAIVTPVVWLVAFGGGLGASVQVGGVGYQTFVFPGVLSMAVLFTSIFYGMYIVWDRKMDFLKEVLVAPVPRSAVFLGKMFGGTAGVVVEVIALLLFGILLSIPIAISTLPTAFAAAMLLSLCIIALGLNIGAKMKSPDGFNLVMSFVVWPMFLFSGALFPLENLPSYLDIAVRLNPLTYGVDLIRFGMLGVTRFGALVDIAVIVLFTLLLIITGSRSFEEMQI